MPENNPFQVLLVEDNPGDADIISNRLADVPGYRFEVTHAIKLQEAIEALNNFRMDAVILDLDLPDSNGVETLKRLRNIRDDVAIVALSEISDEEIHRLALREGAHDFIGKNDPPARLLARSILYALERNRSQEPQRQIIRLISAHPDAIIVVDESGVVQFVNEAALELFGKRQEDFVGELLGFSVKEGEISQIEVLRGKERRSAEMHVVQIKWNWKPAFLASIRDVTDRQQLAEQLRQSQKMEAVGRLAGGVAHDFNNLLTVILGYGSLLKQELPDDEGQRSSLQQMIDAAERASSLTQQLLAFSRRQVLQPRVLDLNRVVRDMGGLLKRVIREDITLRCDFHFAACCIEADRSQIEQVIMNLAVNARDAMPDGGELFFKTSVVWLDDIYARNHEDVKPGSHVVLSVIDTGHGMDKETRTNIFEPFFTTKEFGKGTGLGLATVYGIVKQSGGHIWVYSEPGLGTTFKIYFPESLEETKITVPPIREPASTIGSETILVVEDERAVRELIRETLSGAGYTVLIADNGDEALKLSRDRAAAIHLMITDVVMPGMSGRTLSQILAAERPELRVLFISGYAVDAGIRHGILEPGAALLEKPFDGESLRHKIRYILDAP